LGLYELPAKNLLKKPQPKIAVFLCKIITIFAKNNQ
jgi:hypothetical protein